MWRTITTAIDAKKPVAAGTHDDGGPVNYTNTSVHGDHAYSIVGYEKVGNDRILIIRNQLGESEPAGNGGQRRRVQAEARRVPEALRQRDDHELSDAQDPAGRRRPPSWLE